MTIYTVHIPPQEGQENPGQEGARFVREGMNIFALVIPLVWLIWHRLWLPLAAYLLAVLLISIFARYAGTVPGAFLALLPGFYLFIEGNELIRNRLARKGWEFAGVVSAENASEAEIRLFSGSPPERVVSSPGTTGPSSTPPRSFGRQGFGQQSFGMFPE